MELIEYKKRVSNLLDALPGEVQKINNALALSAIPLIIIRLENLGEDGTGKKLGNYSTNPLPTFFYLHKSKGTKGADSAVEALIKQKKKAEGENFKGISYKEFRQANGLETNFVNLSFTGETLGDIAVLSSIAEGFVVTTTVGSNAAHSKQKFKADGTVNGSITTAKVLDYLGLRYGENILALTTEEQAKLAISYDIELQKLINKYLEA